MNNEVKFFEDYTHTFDLNLAKIKEKYDHTYRVVNYADEIAKSLNLNEEELTRAKICALFHDIGRFSQYTEYMTYNDSKSFDHGDKSYDVLKENGYKDEIVLYAVKYHNKKEVPVTSGNATMHCNIVRDADKIDIMDTQINVLDRYDNEYTEDIINCFKEHKLLNNSEDDTKFYNLLRMLAFIFDINYKKSIEIIIEKNIIDRKLDILRKNAHSEEVDIIEREIKNYIKERFDITC